MNLDLILAGGGLANSLIAYRLATVRPEIELRVIERGPTLGGNHTWSFHDSDLDAQERAWLAPVVAHSWPQHELHFPERRRVIPRGYNSISSSRLHHVVGAVLGNRVLTNAEIVDVQPTSVSLADGTVIGGRAVIDGRGHPGSSWLDVRYQKFVGLFVRLEEECGLAGPILMDATVVQRDGYRFVYTLPFSGRELLIEDTYYSDTTALDRQRLRDGIRAYADRRGWRIAEITGEEAGVLPITLGGDIQAFWSDGANDVPRSGMRAALFHPTTGYSLLEAVRLADEIARVGVRDAASLFGLCQRRSLDLWRRNAYFRLLNRMLFLAAEPNQRYRIFERFYGLPGGLIERFYAGRLGWIDKLRVLIGKPPVPILRALRCVVEPSPARRRQSTQHANEEAGS